MYPYHYLHVLSLARSFPYKKATNITGAKFLLEQILPSWRIPLALISDQGTLGQKDSASFSSVPKITLFLSSPVIWNDWASKQTIKTKIWKTLWETQSSMAQSLVLDPNCSPFSPYQTTTALWNNYCQNCENSILNMGNKILQWS